MNLSEPKSNQKATIRGTDPFTACGTANAAVYGNTASANFSGNSMAMTSTLMMKTEGGMAIYVHEE